MNKDALSTSSDARQEQLLLREQIEVLKAELEAVEVKTEAFETMLRSQLMNELIEVQELTVLYKQQKQEKKTRRLDQKRKGKNYKEPTGLKSVARKQPTQENPDEAREKKRLYREAMLHVHPDKFSMNDGNTDLATAITTQLITIYKTGNLAELQSFHAHIFSNELLPLTTTTVKIAPADAHDYLRKEKKQLEEKLNLAKNRQTYQVLTTYADPMTFVWELKAYYQDKIYKLRRRTRTA